MTSDRDRRVLDGIEQQLRGTDPDLCDRLGRLDPGPRALDRLVGTPAISAGFGALVLALLLGLPGPALLLSAVVFVALLVRLAGPGTGAPEPTRHRDPPPFGPPPGWLR